jgi:N-acetylglucosamine-6-phosphate deacetylase
MTFALVNGRVLSERGIVEGQAVIVAGGRIQSLTSEADLPTGISHRRDLDGGLLLPGFVDVQVNGGGGVLFGDAPSVETLRRIARAHRRFGTTGFLPTLISADLKAIAEAIAAVDAAIEEGMAGILGIHIEGPFLSPERKGIHDSSKFRLLDAEAYRLLTSVKRGKTLVTLAPEETTPETIGRLVAAGVIVSAGHTDATYVETRRALDHGLSGFTHLFNAMSPMTSREPGAVGAALEDRDSWCGVIVDGKHVDPVVLRIALRCKRADRMMLITDAMPSVGSDEKTFELQGQTILVEDGACVAPDGTLAGSDLDMAGAVRNAIALLGLDLHAAVEMASRNPAAFLGLEEDMGRIAPGCRANLVLATDTLEVVETWIDGRGIEDW